MQFFLAFFICLLGAFIASLGVIIGTVCGFKFFNKISKTVISRFISVLVLIVVVMYEILEKVSIIRRAAFGDKGGNGWRRNLIIRCQRVVAV
jgi:multisubunit Na+/H+ antiporter MnhE subunit